MKSQDSFAISSKGSGGKWHWDDFISDPIKAHMSLIRYEPKLPWSSHFSAQAGIDELTRLLVKAEALAGTLH